MYNAHTGSFSAAMIGRTSFDRLMYERQKDRMRFKDCRNTLFRFIPQLRPIYRGSLKARSASPALSIYPISIPLFFFLALKNYFAFVLLYALLFHYLGGTVVVVKHVVCNTNGNLFFGRNVCDCK